jgi:hypothetical protein
MKQKDVFKKIGGIIQELSDQYEYLKTANEDLNDLELELFAANAHFLADHIEILCKLNLQKINDKKSAEGKPETKPEVTPEFIPEVKSEIKPEAKPEVKSEIKPEIKPEVKREIPSFKPEKEEKPEKRTSTYEQKFFEPVVRQMKHQDEEANKTGKELFKPIEFEISPIAEEEAPVPSIDIAAAAPTDEYSYTRVEPEVAEPEPETIRHQLILDESMDFDEDEKAELNEIEIPEPELEISSRIKKTETPDIFAALEKETVFVNDYEEAPAPPPQETAPKQEEEEVLTINQKMSSHLKDKVISRTEQLSIKPISDIKQAITLNDKLLYVKDLFNGYNLAYSEAIEILNRFNTFDEAARFLKTNYVSKNNWDGKPATVEKFYALLKRRYA